MWVNRWIRNPAVGPHKAYGKRGAGGKIPGDAALVFTMLGKPFCLKFQVRLELLKIKGWLISMDSCEL